MKKLLAIGMGALSLMSLGLAAGGHKGESGWSSDLKAAMAQAKKTHKVVMIDFSAVWCGPCKLLRNKVFTTADFKKASKDMILVAIDIDKQKDIADKFKVDGIPDLRFLNSKGQQVNKVVGYESASQLVSDINRAKAKN